MEIVSSNNLGVEITLTDNSPEVKAALKNAIARALFAIGEEAETNAKQVIIQGIREAERGNLIREYEEKKEDISQKEIDEIMDIFEDEDGVIFEK